MDKKKIIELLTQLATGFYKTQITQEHKNGETKTKKSKVFIPGDTRAIPYLIQLVNSEKVEKSIENDLPLDKTMDDLRTAVMDAEGIIKNYEQTKKPSKTVS